MDAETHLLCSPLGRNQKWPYGGNRQSVAKLQRHMTTMKLFGTNKQAMKCKKMVNKALIGKNNIRIKLTKYEEIDEVEDFEEDYYSDYILEDSNLENY